MAKNRREKIPVPPGGWPTNSKKQAPLLEVTQADKKVPKSLKSSTDSGRKTIVWRFGWADEGGEWDPNNLPPHKLKHLLGKLRSFESMTVNEIFHSGREEGKCYEIAAMGSKVIRRLSELQRDDEDLIYRLRITGPERLYGFLRDEVFHIVWWDPKHQVYPSTKRNT